MTERGGDARTDEGFSKLAGLHRLAGLPAETLKELDSICRTRTVRRGQTVVSVDQEPDFVVYVLRGVLRMQKTLQDGRQQIVGLLVDGDMFLRILGQPMTIDVEAAADTEICVFDRGRFEALQYRSPDLERFVLLNLLNELDRARDWMIILSNQRVRGRLAGFLLVLCSRFATVDHWLRVGDRTVEVSIPIGREDLAHLLGARAESISRAFHALADSGVIALRKPDVIEILDLDALIAESGDDELGQNLTLEHLAKTLLNRMT